MKVFDLSPIDGRKSFYGKAVVIKQDGISKLKSYDTVVAEYNHATNEMDVKGWFSATTARHINAFLSFYGFDTCTKKEMQNYSCIAQ
jgi:hypothetical protein